MTKRERTYQRLLIAVLALILGLLGSYFLEVLFKQQETFSTRVADEIVRFHVIPDHDSEADERLKQAVRDDMLKFLEIRQKELETEKKTSKEEFLEEISNSLTDMELLAKSRIMAEGYNYEVKAVCESIWFPQKVFEQYVFPEGYYDTIEIVIGKGKGSNWWGVTYPNLCMTRGTYQVFSKQTDDKLKRMLLAEDYENLLHAKRERVHVRCKSYEVIKEVLQSLP